MSRGSRPTPTRTARRRGGGPTCCSPPRKSWSSSTATDGTRRRSDGSSTPRRLRCSKIWATSSSASPTKTWSRRTERGLWRGSGGRWGLLELARALPEQLAGDDQQLDLLGALEQVQDLGVA